MACCSIFDARLVLGFGFRTWFQSCAIKPCKCRSGFFWSCAKLSCAKRSRSASSCWRLVGSQSFLQEGSTSPVGVGTLLQSIKFTEALLPDPFKYQCQSWVKLEGFWMGPGSSQCVFRKWCCRQLAVCSSLSFILCFCTVFSDSIDIVTPVLNTQSNSTPPIVPFVVSTVLLVLRQIELRLFTVCCVFLSSSFFRWGFIVFDELDLILLLIWILNLDLVYIVIVVLGRVWPHIRHKHHCPRFSKKILF